MEPNKWRFGSDDFPFQKGDFKVNHDALQAITGKYLPSSSKKQKNIRGAWKSKEKTTLKICTNYKYINYTAY